MFNTAMGLKSAAETFIGVARSQAWQSHFGIALL